MKKITSVLMIMAVLALIINGLAFGAFPTQTPKKITKGATTDTNWIYITPTKNAVYAEVYTQYSGAIAFKVGSDWTVPTANGGRKLFGLAGYNDSFYLKGVTSIGIKTDVTGNYEVIEYVQ